MYNRVGPFNVLAGNISSDRKCPSPEGLFPWLTFHEPLVPKSFSNGSLITMLRKCLLSDQSTHQPAIEDMYLYLSE